MARLVPKTETDGAIPVIELSPGVNRFGRCPERNNHVVADISVSETHCEILVDGDLVFLRDLGSTNGTYVDGKRTQEASLYAGQTVRIGPIEFGLEAPEIRLVLPELPPPQVETIPVAPFLPDGYPACPGHATRHAVWECTFCQSVFCSECVKKIGRVKGPKIKLCARCSHPVKLTAWSEMMLAKKPGLMKRLANKLKDTFTKRTTKQL